MRSFVDEHKVTGWIFDEYTHPKGLYYKKEAPVKVDAPKVETPKVVVAAPKVKEKKK